MKKKEGKQTLARFKKNPLIELFKKPKNKNNIKN
jgi:hypothetical protein